MRLPNPYGRYYDPLISQYMLQDEMARRENEERYLDLVAGRQDTRERIMGDLADYGQSRIDDVNRRADINNKNDVSYLTSRGLGASNIVAGTRRQNDTERERELRRTQDEIINRRVGTDAQLSDQLHSLVERRNDVQPDPNQLARLSQGMGAMGMGYGRSPYNASRYPAPAFRGGGASPMLDGRQGYVAGGLAGSYGQNQFLDYSRPGQTPGGRDDQFSNALGRYGNRMAAMGGYGGAYGSPYGPPTSMFPGLRFAGQSSASALLDRGAPQLPQQTYQNNPDRIRDEKLYQSQFGTHSGKQQFSNFKSNPIARQYGGFGSNMWNEQPAQLAPAMGNISYGNPAQQMGQLQQGALASSGRYPTMPYGYPLGQPSTGSRNNNLRRATTQAAASAYLPFGPFNPFALLDK